jgi:hypothetical protein
MNWKEASGGADARFKVVSWNSTKMLHTLWVSLIVYCYMLSILVSPRFVTNDTSLLYNSCANHAPLHFCPDYAHATAPSKPTSDIRHLNIRCSPAY